jgi:hypothetical protein
MTDDMCEMTEGERELVKLQHDYAWKSHESSTQKRMQFFGFFMVAVGVLAAAYITALEKALYLPAFFVCFFGICISIASIHFDNRMSTFVKRAQLVLNTLERKTIFPDTCRTIAPAGQKGEQLGLTRLEPDTQAAEGVGRQGFILMRWLRFAWGSEGAQAGGESIKVKMVLCYIERVAAIVFVAGCIYAVLLQFCPCLRPGQVKPAVQPVELSGAVVVAPAGDASPPHPPVPTPNAGADDTSTGTDTGDAPASALPAEAQDQDKDCTAVFYPQYPSACDMDQPPDSESQTPGCVAPEE